MTASSSAAPTHAGAVVYRRADTGPEFLLVEATGTRNDWVLPKGHLEPGESPAKAAVREVREEAAVEGSLGPFLETQEFEARGERVRVMWWLLRAERDVPASEARRKRWCNLDQALAAVRHDAQRNLLRRANALVTGG